jgi:hypothetical protein
MIIRRSTGASVREFDQDLEKDRRTASERAPLGDQSRQQMDASASLTHATLAA